MRLSRAFGLLIDLRSAIQLALLPTTRALWHTPRLVFKPVMVSRLFMAKVWLTFGDLVDEGGKDVKSNLIPANAHGTVLDIGAGQTTNPYRNFNRIVTFSL